MPGTASADHLHFYAPSHRRAPVSGSLARHVPRGTPADCSFSRRLEASGIRYTSILHLVAGQAHSRPRSDGPSRCVHSGLCESRSAVSALQPPGPGLPVSPLFTGDSPPPVRWRREEAGKARQGKARQDARFSTHATSDHSTLISSHSYQTWTECTVQKPFG